MFFTCRFPGHKLSINFNSKSTSYTHPWFLTPRFFFHPTSVGKQGRLPVFQGIDFPPLVYLFTKGVRLFTGISVAFWGLKVCLLDYEEFINSLHWWDAMPSAHWFISQLLFFWFLVPLLSCELSLSIYQDPFRKIETTHSYFNRINSVKRISLNFVGGKLL